MGKQARSGMATVSLFGALSLAACAHQEPVTVHAPVEERLPAKAAQPAGPLVAAAPPSNANKEQESVLKTWRSRQEVEAVREVEQQHAQESQTFWAMRKDRESLRPTNIGPGGTCVCFGGDPLCSCR